MRGHVSQISEKLPKALPPAEEEIRKRDGGNSGNERRISMVDWNDPTVIVGFAQFSVAFVLVIFTAFLWKSTEKYAKLTERILKKRKEPDK